MSDALDKALASDEARYRDSVVKSDVIIPAEVGAGGEPIQADAQPAPKPVEAEKPAEPTEIADEDKAKDRQSRNREAEDRRWARITAKLGDATRATEAKDTELTQLREQIARFQAPVAPATEPGQMPPAQPAARAPTQAEIDRMVEERVSTKLFNDDCNKIAAKGRDAFGDGFGEAVGMLWSTVDGLRPDGSFTQAGRAIIEAASEADNPAEILHYLGTNPFEAERIREMSPARMGAAIAKIETSLAAAKAAAKPATSRAPAPLDPVGGGVRVEPGNLGPKNIADWMKWDEENSKKRR